MLLSFFRESRNPCQCYPSPILPFNASNVLIVAGYEEVYDVISALKKRTVKPTCQKHKVFCVRRNPFSLVIFLAASQTEALPPGSDSPLVLALGSPILCFLSQAH